MFSTLMNERHNTTIAIFGGNPNQSIEFKGMHFIPAALLIRSDNSLIGMAGNQVLEWVDIDSEIKTANLKDVRDDDLVPFPQPHS